MFSTEDGRIMSWTFSTFCRDLDNQIFLFHIAPILKAAYLLTYFNLCFNFSFFFVGRKKKSMFYILFLLKFTIHHFGIFFVEFIVLKNTSKNWTGSWPLLYTLLIFNCLIALKQLIVFRKTNFSYKWFSI